MYLCPLVNEDYMEIYLIITIIAIIVMTVLGYFVGNRGKKGLIENVIKTICIEEVKTSRCQNLQVVTPFSIGRKINICEVS